MLDPRAWKALPAGWANSTRLAIKQRPAPLPAAPNGGNLGLPAHVLIAGDGRIAAVKYGERAYDQ